jgi:hypothetical protein
MIKSIIDKIKKILLITAITIAVFAPLWASVRVGLISFVNNEDIAAISFNKRLLDINE